ncbi:MAG: hypothetical protein AB7E37_05035 [Candidatus Altimarinota bacterium]
MKKINKPLVGMLALAFLATPAFVFAGDDSMVQEKTEKQQSESYYDQFKKEFYNDLSQGNFSEIDKKIIGYEADIKYLSENSESEHAKHLSAYKEKLQALKDLKANFESGSVTTASQVSQEVDSAYVENFIKNFSTYENPYSVIDEDYKAEKINKTTWKKAWNYIQEQSKDEVKNSGDKKTEEMKKHLDNKKEDLKKYMEEKNTQVKNKIEEKKQDVKKKVENATLTAESLVKKYKSEFEKTLASKIANLSEERITKVIQNIETAKEKYSALTTITEEQKTKYLAQLDALKSLLETRLNHLKDMIDIDSLFSE